VILIQSELQGGSMHTMRFARQHKRPMAVVVAPDHDFSGELYAGNRRWLDKGDVFAMENPEDLDGFLETVPSR
jgi:DNA processing protein